MVAYPIWQTSVSAAHNAPPSSEIRSAHGGPWTNLAPSTRVGTRMGEGFTYAAMTPGYEIVFGGYAGTAVQGDVWYYGLSGTIAGTWGQMCPSGGALSCSPPNSNTIVAPSPRWGAVFTFVDSSALLFGGCSKAPSSGGGCSAVLGDTWEWAVNWTTGGLPSGYWLELAPAGAACPAPRYDASATAQNPNGANGPTVAAIFGGLNVAGSALGDTWAINNPLGLSPFPSCASRGPWIQQSGISPPASYGGQMSYDEDVDNLALGSSVFFGGSASLSAGPSYTATWDLSCVWTRTAPWSCSWTQLSPSSVPQGRALGGMAWDPSFASGEVIMYGGHDPTGTGTYYHDTWVFSLSTTTWANRTTSTYPGSRQLVGFASDPYNVMTYVIGGWNPNNTVLSDFWEY